jgi:hypothetical protein
MKSFLGERLGNGLLDRCNFDQLNEKLVKVLLVALIISAFKAMLTLPINSLTALVLFCLSVLCLACRENPCTTEVLLGINSRCPLTGLNRAEPRTR